MLDIQAFFVQEGLSLRNLPAEKLVTETYIEHANRTLGPFVLDKQGQHACRLPLRRNTRNPLTPPKSGNPGAACS